MSARAEVYTRGDGLYDWRIIAANGEIVATSGGQGFTERNDAKEALWRVKDLIRGYSLPVVTKDG